MPPCCFGDTLRQGQEIERTGPSRRHKDEHIGTDNTVISLSGADVPLLTIHPRV